MFTYVNNYGKKVLCSLLLNYSRKRIEMPVLLYTPQMIFNITTINNNSQSLYGI